MKKVVKADSFFNFFKPPKVPTEEEEADEDEEEYEMLEQAIEEDYEIGEVLKEKIIEDAINWFTGKALEYEGEDEDDEYDGEDFDDLGDEEDEDDDAAVHPVFLFLLFASDFRMLPIRPPSASSSKSCLSVPVCLFSVCNKRISLFLLSFSSINCLSIELTDNRINTESNKQKSILQRNNYK